MVNENIRVKGFQEEKPEVRNFLKNVILFASKAYILWVSQLCSLFGVQGYR